MTASNVAMAKTDSMKNDGNSGMTKPSRVRVIALLSLMFTVELLE